MTPDELCFPLEYLFLFTQCIRNQHFRIFYFK